ncbi:LOW QUALITY PROTEIN: hypothetical protein OSB04_un001451 [Centaurea solstitialis]|uniref:Uncharacterized protein n=1 Tax=Centaurea solstitialis TaxID=347529 RepID=A0AA38S383_9ASTR|nr:LOW QUALITY PROTEIN: hypothetical protein OSB04_un001451 [Centaurea solstitialis]
MKIDGECPIELIGSCRNKVQVSRSDASAAYITALPLDTYRNINGSSRRDLLLNSQNFCRSIPAGARTRRCLGCATAGSGELSAPHLATHFYRGHDNGYTNRHSRFRFVHYRSRGCFTLRRNAPLPMQTSWLFSAPPPPFITERSFRGLSCLSPIVSLADLDPCYFEVISKFASIWYRSRGPHRNSALPLDVQSTAAPQRISGRTTSSGFEWHFTPNHNSSADSSTSVGSDLHLVQHSTARLQHDAFIALPQPRFHGFWLLPFRSPLLRESLLLSFPLATKMFQFARLSLACPWIQQQFERLTYSRGISGSILIFNSPKHFVAYYALPRLWCLALYRLSSRVGDKRTRTADIRRRDSCGSGGSSYRKPERELSPLPTLWP